MSGKTLQLTVPVQQRENWCWAATTVGVNHFYDPQSGRTQCDVVNRRLGRDDCCVSNNGPLPAACNAQSGLTLPLYEACHHRVTYANQLSFTEVVAEIENDRPVCVRVVWYQGLGDGHFLVITGYIKGESGEIADVMVEDSYHGPSIHTFEAFQRFYRTTVQTPEGQELPQDGRWTHSYCTQPQVAFASRSADQKQ
ncbi:MAG: papain-like cysteine protease family protein [Tateyamaria sp.]|uniref:papain-like cysteine protease family protein n=1 Tax=Tateyamaria sp. TaxID=1929288 RepID=UPI00329A8CFB